MTDNSIFYFKDKKDNGDYDLYIFHDFSGTENSNNSDIFSALDEVRNRVHSPDIIFIICIDDSNFEKQKHKSRFTNGQNIEYINYKDITGDIFKIGINQIVRNNKVVQHAPHGAKFKKTSGKESSYFIKASLSLLEYPQICFLALSLYQKIENKISDIGKFYIDTSSIMPLIQTLIYYQTIASKKHFHPEIINFKSYNDNNIDFNTRGSYSIISASSSGGLQKEMDVDQDKCITIFLPISVEEECLFRVDIESQHSLSASLVPIPLTAEDFSLEYAKSEEVIITKKLVEKLDSKKLITKLLSDEFKKVKYSFLHDEFYNKCLLKFDEVFLDKVLAKRFTSNILNRCLLSEKDNYVIYRGKTPKNKGKFNKVKVEDFLANGLGVMDANVIVFLNQSDKNELIQISRRLRRESVFNITYVIGILLAENIAQSMNLQNNICFNDTDYKYEFYCYLDLPLLTISDIDDDHGMLSDGFIFYEGSKSSKPNKKPVYLVFCLILELFRHNNKLSDNISFHHVLSPKNFSRFNDSLLQLSILYAAKGRELNFSSNKNLSYEMRNIIIDIMNENENIGEIFINFTKNKKIHLTGEDFDKIKSKFHRLFEEENTI